MTLAVDIRHRLGDFRLDARFETDGRLVALFGPSGSGKTSLVNLIAGLLQPDEGRIVVDGRVLADTATGTFVPVHRRRVGYVFQDARLFPHLTVAQNLRYGRWFAPRGERHADMGARGRDARHRPAARAAARARCPAASGSASPSAGRCWPARC